MVVFPCMVGIVIHCPTVYAPVTHWSVSDAWRELRGDLHTVSQDHLEPQVVPTEVTYRSVLFELDVSGD